MYYGVAFVGGLVVGGVLAYLYAAKVVALVEAEVALLHEKVDELIEAVKKVV